MTQSPNANQPWQYRGYTLGDSSFATAIIHLYRAEITRANTWRTRLDTTTNWAVGTTGAALTFAFSSPQNPHFVLLLTFILMLVFLNIEARRYRHYTLWHHRVRLIETGFFARTVAPPYHPPADWGTALHDTLTTPVFPISRAEAIGHRYRRNYVWMSTLLLISWLLKLSYHPVPAQSFRELCSRAAIAGVIPAAWVIAIVAAIYVGLLILAIVTARSYYRKMPYRRKRFWWPQANPPTQYLAAIITGQGEEVAALLMRELGRGVTALEGTGMYTKSARTVLLCAITQEQRPLLEKLVLAADPQAFVIIEEAAQVHGRGFTQFVPPP